MRNDVGRVRRRGRRLEGRRHRLGGRRRGLLRVVLRVGQHQRLPQHLVHVLDELDLDRLQDDGRDLPDVLLVLHRDEDLLDAAAMRRQDLLLQAPDGQHVAPQRHLAGHGEIVSDRDARQRRDQSGRHGDAGRRAVLGDRTLRDVNVNVDLLVEVALEPELLGAGAHVAHRCLRRLLHHLAQAAGDEQLPLAGHHLHLGGEQLAAHVGPRQPGRDADLVLDFRLSVAVARRAEVRVQALRGHPDAGVAVLLHHLDRDLSTHTGDLALEVPDTRLLRVVADDRHERRVGEDDVLGLQAVRLVLLRDQIFLGDVQLLELRVARDADDLHAVLERARDAVEGVRGGDEHDLREVVVHVQVVVVEGAVLLGIEHLQQRRRRVAAEVGGHLVHLVEQEDRFARAGALHALDDLARQRADVGAAVAADLGLVAHAAQRHAHELPAGGTRDRLAERGLAHAGRPDQTEDGPLGVADQALHREVLEDALLHLLEAEVVVLEDLLRLFDVELVLGVLVPGQGDQPVDVVTDDGRLGGHGRHHLELLQLLLGLLAGLRRHLLLLDLLFQLLDLVLELVLLAELLLDRAHLLVEVVLLLGLLHLLLDPGTDTLLDLEDLDLGAHEAEHLLEALGRVGHLEQRLLVLELDAEVGDDRVGEPRGLVDRGHRHDHLGRDLLVELDVGLEGGVDAADEGFDLGRLVAHLLEGLGLDQEVLGVAQVARDARPLLALDQHLDGAVGQAEELHDRAERADPVDVVLGGVIGLGVLLRREEDELLLVHRLLEGADRLLPPDEERHHHVREDDDVPQRQERHAETTRLRRRLARISFLVPEKHSSPVPLCGLGRLLEEDDGLLLVGDDLLRDEDLVDVRLRRDVVHHVEHDVLHDGAQPARARLALERLARDRREGAVGEAEVHAFHLEELLVLPGEGVLRFLQDADQRRLVELLEGGDDREPAHELGDQPELEQVLGLHLVQEVAHGALVLAAYIGAEAHSLDPDAPADDVVEADEGPPADEQDVGRVDLQELLLGMLAAALGRDAGGRPFDDLEQRLLHALARHVARDRGVVALARDLVDLVDVDDAALALLDVVVRVLEEREDDVLDVLADVAGLGQAGGVGDRERHLQEAGERLREERLAAARRPDEQDVRLLQLDVARDQLRVDALVVVVDRDRQDLLGALLADHVLVEDLLDLGRLRHRRGGREGLLLVDLLRDDVVAEVDALVADVDGRAGDQLADLVLALATERADEVAGAVVTVLRHETPYVFVSLPGRVTMTSSTSPYSTACLPVRKRSRSVSFSIFFKLCPVCFTRMLFICSRSRMISRAWMSMSVAWPCTPPSGWWIMMRACGSAKRLPLAPAASSQAAMLAACPTHRVETSGLMYCMVS